MRTITTKLTRIYLIVAVSVLISAGSISQVYLYLYARSVAHENLRTQAFALAGNLESAVTFSDAGFAQQTLNALQHYPDVRMAAVILSDGTTFAEYGLRDDPGIIDVQQRSLTAGEAMDADIHGVVQTIALQGQAPARLVLVASLETLNRETLLTVAVGLMIGALILSTAFTMFRRMSRAVIHPLETLTAVMRSVEREGDHRKRVNVFTDDEFGELAKGFNAMLAALERQNVSLNAELEERKRIQEKLDNLAYYDALTTLPNRVLLADRLQHAMTQAQRHRLSVAVVYLDLDGFKAVNDDHGHHAGDQLLMNVATNMKQTLREGDTLARLGGDEFVAVLLDLADAEACVPMLTRLLAAAAQPMQIDDLVLQISASLGVTFFPQGEDVDADQLMRQADQAMYQAKLAGKNNYHIFDAAHDRSVRGRYESLERIRRALVEGEFVLHFQPKVNMRSGAVIGVEALIRWQHPEQGLLPPRVFLPVIENHPLAIELGEWVIDGALARIEAWRAEGLPLRVSVNVSAHQLQQAVFVERLSESLAAHPGVEPYDLEFEVLETSALEDLNGVSRVIEACREIGVMFALDDFGTGYSSLTYLKRLPVPLLKIDQSFVHDIPCDPDALAMLESMLALAGTIRRQAIAEGVETLEHGVLLLQLGCEQAQGFGIAPPMPAEDIPGWLASWRPDPAWSDVAPVNREDMLLLFACVEHRAWVAILDSQLREDRKGKIPLELHQCRFCDWMESDGRSRYGAEPAFQALETVHHDVHARAEEMLALLSQGRFEEVAARRPEILALHDVLFKRVVALLHANSSHEKQGVIK